MKLHTIGGIFAAIFLLTACNATGRSMFTQTLVESTTTNNTSTPELVPTLTSIVTITPEAIHPGPSNTMLEQDFESEMAIKAFPLRGEWAITSDENDNSIFCNTASTDWSAFRFGTPAWNNYTVELRMKFTDQRPDQSVEIYSRINTGYEGYRSSVGLGWGAIGYYPPPQSLTEFPMPIQANTWYRLRVETYGNQVLFYIDGKLISQVNDSQSMEGMAGFGVAPNSRACVDDIRVWALTETGSLGQAPVTLHPALELVTDQAVTGDGGNPWGGHQTRIVHTRDGIFTAYTVESGGHFAREWRLAWRQPDGNWQIAASGNAGREPVNLLASPNGTLHVIGWPNQTGTMWSGKPENGNLEMARETIPNMATSDWPYGAAGIDAEGNLCVLSSIGGEEPGGEFRLACYLVLQKEWKTQIVDLDYRYCYTYLFPSPDGQLSLISNRDVLWSALGYSQPADTFDYVFNAVGVWHSNNISEEPLQRVFAVEEVPTEAYPFAYLNAQEDAYKDTSGNLHFLYRIQGESTQGEYVNRHAIISASGEILANVELPETLGEFSRIFQNASGRFFILGSSGVMYPAGMDSVTLDEPINIDLQGYVVESTGFGISAPRTGSTLANVLDVVYPSGDGTEWIYFQIPLPEN